MSHELVDVDGLTGESVSRLATGQLSLRPCAPLGVMRLAVGLHRRSGDLVGAGVPEA